MESPLVSIVCATYNHEPYLARALDGFLMQETTFPIEIILAEDCSTDGTRKVIEDWLDVNVEERQEGNLYLLKNGMLLRYIWSENNVGANANEKRAMAAASGKYIAFCEGDDYWTDSKKLQKQFDFLEQNPDVVACYTRFYILEGGNIREDYIGDLFKKEYELRLNEDIFCHRWTTQYLTMMFRKEKLPYNLCDVFTNYRDTHQMVYLYHQGVLAVLNFFGGVYRVTGKGIYTSKPSFEKHVLNVNVYRDLWKMFHTPTTKSLYMQAMQNAIDDRATDKYKNKWNLYEWILCRFIYTGEVKRLLKNIVRVLRRI